MVMQIHPYVFLFVGMTGFLTPWLGRDRGTVSERSRWLGSAESSYIERPEFHLKVKWIFNDAQPDLTGNLMPDASGIGLFISRLVICSNDRIGVDQMINSSS
ncbi:hypothetical protein [Pseudomonas sp. NPDC086251]|jgi:hypothetical protein|uniref:hypothetical protein n=1 Tax=Pseudomonas sp. NPDC086251 TaxID=3364431 RepID=UPI0038371411